MVQVTYRHHLQSAPTDQDITFELGIEDFYQKLKEEGWMDKDGRTVVNYLISMQTHEEEGNNYIEWTATANEH